MLSLSLRTSVSSISPAETGRTEYTICTGQAGSDPSQTPKAYHGRTGGRPAPC